jgi:hypothetical protein
MNKTQLIEYFEKIKGGSIKLNPLSNFLYLKFNMKFL